MLHVPAASGLLLIIVVGGIATAAPSGATSTASTASAPLTLRRAVTAALARNPALAGADARARALAAVPSQAGALPDPVLSLNAMNLPTDSFSLSQEAMTQLQVGIRQGIPFPGKRALRAEAALRHAQAAGDDVQELRLTLVHRVRDGWWHLFYLDRALETVTRNQALMRQLVSVAQTKYRVGRGLQQDVLLAQLELSRLLDREMELKGMRRQAEARLNALMDRPTDDPIALPRRAAADLPAVPARPALSARAWAGRPLLEAQRRRVAAAESRVELARRDRYPDFGIGATYGFRRGYNPNGSDRADFASVMLTMTLPLYAGSNQDHQVDQRTRERLAARHTLQDLRERTDEEISRALADYRRARAQFTLFRTGIVPQARQTVDAMLAGYQVNKVDFLNLVRAEGTLYDYETRYWRAFTDAQRALAALAAATGQEQLP